MIQVWCYDENNIFTESIRVDEVAENMTTISPNGLGLYCKKWNGSKWVEGWTVEEIRAFNEPQIDIPQEQTLEDKISILNHEMDTRTLENEELTEYTVELDYRLASIELFM